MITVSRDVSLFKLEQALLDLVELREIAETDEEKAIADEALKAYTQAAVKKVDGILGYMRHCSGHADTANAEALRMGAISKLWLRRRERLEGIVLAVMIDSKKEKLEGNLGEFAVRGNPPSVEITDPSLLPEEMVQYSGTISGQAWGDLLSTLARFSDFSIDRWVQRQDVQMERVPMKAKIAAALKQPCEVCGGDAFEGAIEHCAECGGSGKKHIAGARLISDKVRLQVK